MGLFSSKSKTKFNWIELKSEQQLDELIASSATTPVLLFKHSTRCSISSMALNRFESNWTADQQACTCVYLDLIALRPISNAIASKLKVEHQSPQAILIKDKKVVHVSTHGDINAKRIQENL